METRVCIAKCEEYEQAEAAVERVLDAFGGAETILAGRKRVIVKPNLIMPRKPEDAATTHPAVAAAICKAFINAGADVQIIDSTGYPHTKLLLRRLYEKTGMTEAAEMSGASLSYNTSSRKVKFPDGHVLKKIELLKPIAEAELVISAAKAKTHGFQSMTGCVKNLFGSIPGMGKPMMHSRFTSREKFAAMLVDVCRCVNPGFCILDGVWGMEGPGPTGGEPKHLAVIAGSPSPYAMDLAQCHLMGLRLDSVYTIAQAVRLGLAPALPDELTWLGDNPEKIRMSFKPAGKHTKDAVPVITDKCVMCGECARICPVKCISASGKLPLPDESRCIRCYCCHEFCPAKAIDI